MTKFVLKVKTFEGTFELANMVVKDVKGEKWLVPEDSDARKKNKEDIYFLCPFVPTKKK